MSKEFSLNIMTENAFNIYDFNTLLLKLVFYLGKIDLPIRS